MKRKYIKKKIYGKGAEEARSKCTSALSGGLLLNVFSKLQIKPTCGI